MIEVTQIVLSRMFSRYFMKGKISQNAPVNVSANIWASYDLCQAVNKPEEGDQHQRTWAKLKEDKPYRELPHSLHLTQSSLLFKFSSANHFALNSRRVLNGDGDC